MELRLSIPTGILLLEMNWLEVLIVCVATNMALGPTVYFLLQKFASVVTKIRLFNSLYETLVLRTRRRTEPFVKRFGLIGIALFIALPLPGSGSWSGALAAFVLGVGPKRFAIANAVGVLFAGSIITAMALGIMSVSWLPSIP